MVLEDEAAKGLALSSPPSSPHHPEQGDRAWNTGRAVHPEDDASNAEEERPPTGAPHVQLHIGQTDESLADLLPPVQPSRRIYVEFATVCAYVRGMKGRRLVQDAAASF